jgi:hypothetical protein
MLTSWRWLASAHLVVFAVVLSACATVPEETDTNDLASAPKGPKDGKGDVVLGAPASATLPGDAEHPADAACTHECTNEGDKRCATTSGSSTELCAKASDGCRKWTQGPDCPVDFTCNKTTNDGTCQAGCTNDAGCSATSAGVAHCTADGKTELTCTKVGACYVFKTTRTDVVQQCTSPTYCGATTGRRINCVASAAGACTQHVATVNDCPAGTACSGAGQCVATCTNDAGCSASNLYATKCNGTRSRLTCAKSGACYKWLAATACSPDETCSAGSCVASCTNACTKGTSRCVAGASRATQSCVTGASGCTVWAAGASCAPDSVCTNGACN